MIEQAHQELEALGHKAMDTIELTLLRSKWKMLQTENSNKSKTIAALKARLKACGCADK